MPTRALTLATVIGSDGALNLADVAGLATVAGTGSYTDLTNKPTLFSGSYTDLTNKPTVYSQSESDAKYLTANQTITVSGDASGSGSTSIALTLATVPVAKGGTGATTQQAAINALAGSTTSAQFLSLIHI